MQATEPNNLYSRKSFGGGGGGGGASSDSSSDSYEVAQVTGRGGVYSGSRAIIEKIGNNLPGATVREGEELLANPEATPHGHPDGDAYSGYPGGDADGR